MASVASQIRIDLIAQTASFSAGMREGQKAVQSFREEYNKLSRMRSFKGREFGSESMAWTHAMRFGDGGSSQGPLANSFYLGNDTRSANRKRWDSMLFEERDRTPWGKSFRTELSREAAETAAFLGAQGKRIGRSYAEAMKDISGEAARATGMGGLFGGALKFAGSPSGAATIGVGALAGWMTQTIRERDQLIRDVKADMSRFGSSSQEASLLRGVGMDESALSNFQRALSRRSPGDLDTFRQLNLDPDRLGTQSLSRSLLEVGDAFGKIKSPADRANLSMELFGRSGAEMIGTLASMREKMEEVGKVDIVKPADIERVKHWDKALREVKSSLHEISIIGSRKLGSESGLGTMIVRGWEGMLTGTTQGWDKALDKAARWEKEDLAAEFADLRAMRKAGVDKKTIATLNKLRKSGGLNEEQYADRAAEEIDKVQIKQRERDTETDRERQAKNKLADLNNDLYGLQFGEAAKRRKEFMEELQSIGIRGNVDEHGRIGGPLGDYMQQYDRGIENRERAKEKANREKERQAELERKERQEADEAEELFRRQDAMKKRLRSPEQIARDDLSELMDYRNSLSAEEFDRGKAQIAERLAGTMGGGEISPVGMMGAGSAEFHSLVAKANTPDPKNEVSRETNQILERILDELREQRGETLQ